MTRIELKKPLWILEPVDEDAISRLSSEARLPFLAALVLYRRGYRDIISVERFRNPSLDHLHDPFLLEGMKPAVERLVKAKERGEKVLIHGDYDVDGVSATALLIKGFERIGIGAEYYLPRRIEEGYGLSARAIEEAKRINASLILTVDCGVTAIEEAQLALRAGIDLIVTDHHEPGEQLPEALAVIDPKRADSKYPFSELAGVGVAFKLLAALTTSLKGSLDLVYEDLDLVALGTIADVAPLIGENRVFARFGLGKITQAINPGIKALLDISNLKGKTVTSQNVAFALAPRLNASGRMSDALSALKLLITRDEEEAGILALELDKHNTVRKETESAILETARILAEREIMERNPRVLVLHRSGWHEGVIGIVASRLVDDYYRPVILFADKDGKLKGSGRSIPGFNLHDALFSVRSHLESFGGHAAAAGLVMERNELKSFTGAINECALSYPQDLFEPKLRLDAFVELNELAGELKDALEVFKPYGVGNPEPCFATRGLEVVGTPRVFGKDHLTFTVRKGETIMPVMAFGGAELVLSLESGLKDALDIVYRINEDNYWGKKMLKLVARDIKLVKTPESQ